MKPGKILKNGLYDNNPVLVQFIGMCSTLAVTTTVINSFAMSMAVLVVLVGSNVVISLLRKVIPDKIRIPAFIVVIATFVTMIQMFLQAYALPIYEALGIFLPLIVVNCIILGRAESFASKNSVGAAFIDGIGSGLGYTVALVILGAIREILGKGQIFGVNIFPESFRPIGVFAKPPGAFILLGLMVGAMNLIKARQAKKMKEGE